VTRPINTTPFTVLAGTCVFAQGPFPPTASLPTVGTFNFGTGVTVTEAAATGVTVTAIGSPTGGSLSGVSMPNRTATITLNQAWLPNSLFNEIAFTNSAAAVQPAFRTRLDFDGDGKADPVIFRPSTGTWWFAASGSGMAFRAFQWGQADDNLVSADYDGDGITDYAVYRKGAWYVMGSSAGYMAVPFGTATDIPQPGDYDGDGKADFVVYRPSEGIWYMMLTTGTSAGVQFGISTDRPVAADFDGDGKMDPAVYRNGTWYILASSTGFHAATFGVATDVTVPADYDGDHKADLAVYRGGEWYILRSTDGGVSAFQWGTAGDVPVPADYNGDGMTDVSVYRPSSSTWFMNYSGQNSVSPNFRFGSSGDQNVNY